MKKHVPANIMKGMDGIHTHQEAPCLNMIDLSNNSSFLLKRRLKVDKLPHLRET